MACEPITKRVNGIDLHDVDNGWSLQASSSIRVQRTVRRKTLVIPGRHGASNAGLLPVFDEASVGLDWWLTGNGQVSLEAAYHNLVGLLSQPSLSYEHVLDSVVTAAPAVLMDITEPSDFTAGRNMRVRAQLALMDPFLRDAATSDYTAPVGASQVTTMTGTAPVNDAVLRFSGAATDPAVYDGATGTGVKWLGILTAGQHLFIDVANWRAWRSTDPSAWSGVGTDVTGSLDYPPPGRLQLWPATSQAGLFPAGTLYPSIALFPAAAGVAREVNVNVSGGPCVIRARGAWL